MKRNAAVGLFTKPSNLIAWKFAVFGTVYCLPASAEGTQWRAGAVQNREVIL
jgi:hypothetical protein